MLIVRSGTIVDAIDIEREFVEASLGDRDLPFALCASTCSGSCFMTGGGAGPDGCLLAGITRPVLVVCDWVPSPEYEVIDMARSFVFLSGTTRP